jgi:hypothetical protein
MSKYNIVCDVSGYQAPTLVPWDDSRIVGGIVKCNEGNTLSKNLQPHTAAIQKTGKPFGLYTFFRPDVDVDQQFATFLRGAELVGYGDAGYSYIIPAIDVERYVTRKQSGNVWTEPTPSWNPKIEQYIQLLVDKYEELYIYGGTSTWAMLNKPAWWLTHKLWVPRYNYNGKPPPDPDKISTPGGVPWSLAQTLVGPMFSEIQKDNAPNAVDQSCVRDITLLGDAS